MSANIYDKETKTLIPYAGSTTAIIVADYNENEKNIIFLCQTSAPATYDNGNLTVI